MFPKIVVPPNHSFFMRFSIINTIHFGVPLFLETLIYIYMYISNDPNQKKQQDFIIFSFTDQEKRSKATEAH